MSNLNPDMILPKDLQLPQNFEDAIKMAKSLAIWLEFIKAKVQEREGSDPLNSYGGNVEAHITYLNFWFKTEAIKAFDVSLHKEETKGEI